MLQFAGRENVHKQMRKEDADWWTKETASDLLERPLRMSSTVPAQRRQPNGDCLHLPLYQTSSSKKKAQKHCSSALFASDNILCFYLYLSSSLPHFLIRSSSGKRGVGKGEKCQLSSGYHFHWNPHCRRETWMQVLLLAPSGSPAKSSQELKRNRKTFHVTCTMHTTCTLTTQRDTYNCN